jgi:predicted ATPase/DNA-binding NarL/FixJ family response regulator
MDRMAGDEVNAFIGRGRELAELHRLIPEARAMTLCGAPGIGKTRLAQRLVAELADRFPDGAWFVELADLRQPELVASRIAEAIGVMEEPGRPLLATLADALRPRRLLLCLDNCEHLVDSCARVCQRLLASSPGLQVITTSREPLRVAAETVWQVPPLAVPDQASSDDAELLRSDALLLFADRAAAARPDFALTAATSHAAWAAVAGICRALDGLPLAIELAAAWVRVLTVEQIEARLTDRFRLLSSAERTAPPRHRTLRAAIDWSHDLLNPQERVLLRRLSVFASWPLEMAEELCAGGLGDAGGADQLADRDILNLLTALADQSLVIAEPATQGTRYRMLDSVRAYAAERLDEAGESAALHDRFRDYGVREMEQLTRIGMALVPASWETRVAAIHKYEIEAANISQILGRCLAEQDAESGLRICASTRPVWVIQGSFAEGAGWLDAFLGLDADALPASVLGSGLVSRAQLAMATDPAQAGQYAKAGLELCRDSGSEFWAASALNLLAEAALHAGQVDEAAERGLEALAVARSAGERFNEGYASGTLGTVAAFRGDFGAARRLGEVALAIGREIDQQWGAARALLGLGDLARLTGDLDTARDRYQEALPILREVGARPEVARCIAGLGRLAIRQGDLDLAWQYLSESVELSRTTGSRIGVIRGLEAFAALAISTQDSPHAVQLTAAAEALRSEAGLSPRSASRTQRILDAAGLGDQQVQDLWVTGSGLSAEDAIAMALRVSQHVGNREQPPRLPAAESEPALTARQVEIADLVAKGHSNRAIAAELGISQATAARHVADILAKLGFSSRVQIAAWVARRATGRGTGR